MKGIRDELTPFRVFIKRCRHYCRKHGGQKFKTSNLSAKILKEVWDKQGGICPYTNLKMELPANKELGFDGLKSPLNASLDRIDSDKGYNKDNIEFVCLAVNYAKNTFSREEMKDFLAKVVVAA